MNSDAKGNIIIRKNSNGYEPRPLDTKEIELSDNIMLLGERLASNLHDVWGKRRAGENWGYGAVRDDVKKTNPCMVYYDELTEEQKEDDRKSAFEALRFIKAKGYSIVAKKKPTMADAYRMAWTDHGRSDEEISFDAPVFVAMFGTDGYTDKTLLTSKLHRFCESLHELFGQSGDKKHDHTRFAFLSPLETESELLAEKIARAHHIKTYRVAGSAAAASKGDLVAPDGDVTGFICDNSLMALAMWNGLKPEQPGYDERMALIVRRALRGSTERLMELDMPDNITVYHMLMPIDKADQDSLKDKAYSTRVLHPYPLETGTVWYFRGEKSKAGITDEYNCKRFRRNVDKIAHFNRKIKKRRRKVMAEKKVGDLMPGLHGHTNTDRDLLRHLYTDSISFAAQKKRDRQTKLMMWLAVFGLGAFSIMSDAPDVLFGINTSALAPALSIAVLVLLTAAMCIFFYQRLSGSHDEYVNFRMMSECLRVQTYWRASGIEGSVEKEFSSKSKLDFEWARYIFRAWELQNMICAPGSKDLSPDVVREIIKVWYGKQDEYSNGEYRHEASGDTPREDDGVDQYGYTRRKARRSLKDAKRDNVIRVVSVVAAYGLTVIVAALVIAGCFIKGAASLTDHLILLASLVQIVMAGYNLFAATKDYERLANNNTWLSIEYQKAIIASNRALRNNAGRQKQLELFKRTGIEAIREVCSWALEFSRNEPGSPVS